MKKQYVDDQEYLKVLESTVSNLKIKSDITTPETKILMELERLLSISIGTERLLTDKKSYSMVLRWLDELGDISESELGEEFIRLHNYFAEYYTIPKSK